MITGKFEIDFHGLGLQVQEIGSVEIVNTGKNSRRPEYGDYEVRFVENETKTIINVTNHRRSEGFFVLLSKALNKKRKM